MPNTLIREGYLDSDKISALSDFDDRVFFRVLLAADDAGRTDGRVDKLRSALFPTRDTVRNVDVEKALGRLIVAGLLSRWEWDGKPIIQVMRWQRRSGAQYSKFPDIRGSFKISWVKVETRDGEQAFSATSLSDGSRRATEPITNPFEGVSEKSTETETETETKTKTIPPSSVREEAEKRDTADSLVHRLIEEVGIAVNVGPKQRSELADILKIDGYESARNAIQEAIKKGIGMPACLSYAAKIIGSEAAKRDISKRDHKRTRSSVAVREDS